MTINVIQDRLAHYECQSILEEENALKEITQEIGLLALARQDFFSVAEFHGGTALRILYNLQRFSEDLDFALIKPNPNFDFSVYLHEMANAFDEYGYNVTIQDRSKAENTIKKAFLKDRSIGKELKLHYPVHQRNTKTIKIKLEVDINPPEGATTELKYLDFPLPYSVLCKDLASSFSGKIHALLCRQYLKGRDWFDFVWYVSRKADINLSLLSHALNQNGPWQGQGLSVDKAWVIQQLNEKIASIDWIQAKLDVEKFLRTQQRESLTLWSKEFFQSRVEKIT